VGSRRKRGRSGDRVVGRSRGRWGVVGGIVGFGRKRGSVVGIPAWVPPAFRDPMMLLPSDIRRTRKPKLRKT